jgi:hypothetical protein
MSLLDLWLKSKTQLEDKQVQQIIAIAGSGKLLDGSETSAEFRDFLSHVPSNVLSRYAEDCFVSKFQDGGLALQDIVNQVGQRLGFHVEYGRYRGVAGQSGHDGLWVSPFKDTIIVEVKVTDAFRMELDTLANYRRSLIQFGKATEEKSSILIVVGREDTGGLEAQIRGSRHAWNIRLISVDALIRLMLLKENIEDPTILRKVSGVLTPQEFTKLDGIIDLVFSAAEEVLQETESAIGPDVLLSEDSEKKPMSFHDACIQRIEKVLNQSLLKQSRATYASPDNSVFVVCAVSKAYKKASAEFYWYAFHPHQKEKLKQASEGYVAFGCGSEKAVVMIPFKDFQSWLDGMNITRDGDRFYWHVHIRRDERSWMLYPKSGSNKIDLTPYVLH